MQATITYLLSEQAQRAQMVATGQPVARKQTMTMEISDSDLDLFSVGDDGTIHLDLATSAYPRNHSALLASGWTAGGRIGFPLAPRFDPDVVADIRAGIEKQKAEEIQRKKREAEKSAERLARQERAIDLFFSDPDARGSEVGDGRILFRDSTLTELSRAGGFAVDLDPTPRSKEARQEIMRRNQADKAAREAAEAAKESAKQQFVAEWIQTYAEPEVREQFADELLSRKAALSLIAEKAFSDAGIPEVAKWDDDYCDSTDCPCGEKTITTLPRRIYPAWKAIRGGLPEGYAVAFKNVRTCSRKDESYCGDGETAGPVMYLATITLPHGPFLFERTVKLG